MVSTIASLERKSTGHINFSDIIGKSPAFVDVISQAKKSALLSCPVWLEGEVGTGKEQLARAIHGSSKRLHKPFVVVDCERIAECEDAETIIFGRKSSPDSPYFALGKMHEAEGGTLYFKEIGALKPLLQQKLIEMGEELISPSPENSNTSAANVRIMCSNSKIIKNEIAHGTFSHLLYQHLKAVSLELPPLRERKPDIALLTRHFINTQTAIENKYISGLTDDAVHVLEEQPWPGNVQQLYNLLQRATILCNYDQIDVGTLRLVQQLEPVHYALQNNMLSNEAPKMLDMQGQVKKLKFIEEEVIRFTLKHNGGCMTRTARSLGIGRSTLYRKISEMESGHYTALENQDTRPTMEIDSLVNS